jgi:hypothetical protein
MNATGAVVKASSTGPVVAIASAGRPVWTARTYTALIRAGYLRNPIVYRAVRIVAEAAASVPFTLYEGRRELDVHPLLALLTRPNPRQAGAEFLEAIYGHLLLAGNAYVEAVEGGEGVAELHALRPDRMSVVPDARGWPSAFEYAANGRVVRFEQEGDGAVPPILHLAQFHPLDDHYGFPPIEAAQTSLDVHNAASAWNKGLLDNAARPSGALVYEGRDGANLSEEQFRRLAEELRENFQGTANAGRPLLLDGGLSWQAMSQTGAGGSGDIRVVLNKEAGGNTASFILHDNFSGRAEIGIAGDDDLAIKVSADGGSWTEALRIDAADGTVAFPKGVASLRGLMLDATWAAIAAMTVAPLRTRSFLLDDTIGALQAEGLWQKLDVLYLLAAHDAQAARVNIRAPGGSALTAYGAASFTPDSGYAGDGSAAYLGSGFVPGAGDAYDLASAHAGVFILDEIASAGFAAGAAGAAGELALGPRTGGGMLTGSINDLGPALSAAIATSVGHSVVCRDGGSRTLYRDGVAAGTDSLAATALPDSELTVLRAGAGFGPWQVAAAHAGGALTAPESAALHSILAAYLAAVEVI